MQEKETMIKISTRIEDFPVYGKMTHEEVIKEFNELFLPIKKLCDDLRLSWDDIPYSNETIFDIIDNIHRRRIYFHVYHNIEMGELNQACLMCFWILKLSPFYSLIQPEININFTFALAIFTRGVIFTAKKRFKKANLTEDVMLHLKHAFKYRDLSKEAIMAIAESLIA
jgi:hypothetical protein